MLVPLLLTAAGALAPAPAQVVTAPLPSEASFAGEEPEEPVSCFTMEPPGRGWRRLELNELREAYPPRSIGTPFPFRRMFVIAS